ncbi:MAG: ABC transporter permease, partial [Fibrobacteraceae bacterium]|nr:ABC transporter permease [Fibrobacteraceae bacterium]
MLVLNKFKKFKVYALRFCKTRRAFYSFVLLALAYLLSLTSPWTVNDEPFILRYQGKFYFPAFVHYPETEFGGIYNTEPDYKKLLEEAELAGENIFAIMPPIPHDPLKADLSLDGAPPFPPSSKHWLGTDANGRDVLARLIHGFRICLSFSLLLTVLGTFLGILIGGIQGYLGFFWDLAIQRFVEIWASLPFLYVVILIGGIYGRSFILLICIMALFQWISLSYYMRAEFLKLRSVPYV